MSIIGFIPFLLLNTNRDIIKESINWADAKYYSEECKNDEKAFACIKLSGNMLIRELIIIQEEKVRCYKDIISEDFSQMDGECLPTKKMNELKRNRYLIIKRY